MTNNEKKQECIIALLEERGLTYKRNHHSDLCGVDIDLYVPMYRIAVFDGDSQEAYEKVKKKMAPLFIRETDTEEFVMEKMTNLIDAREKKLQWLQECMEKKERNRKYAQECEERHRANADRHEAIERKKEEAARPRRKRIVRYEKIYTL